MPRKSAKEENREITIESDKLYRVRLAKPIKIGDDLLHPRDKHIFKGDFILSLSDDQRDCVEIIGVKEI